LGIVLYKTVNSLRQITGSNTLTTGITLCLAITSSHINDLAEVLKHGKFDALFRVTTCLENLEMSGNLTAVREMSEILLKIREEVTLQLVKSKCIPFLLYGLKVCELNKSQMASLDFTINRFLAERNYVMFG